MTLNTTPWARGLVEPAIVDAIREEARGRWVNLSAKSPQGPLLATVVALDETETSTHEVLRLSGPVAHVIGRLRVALQGCAYCHEPVDGGLSAHPSCCSHERAETRDEADGVAFGGVSRYDVTTCLDCGAELVPVQDEDGETGWEVVW